MLHLLCSSYCKPHHFHEMGCLADVQQRVSRARYPTLIQAARIQLNGTQALS
jgi:hypothetical protein